MLVILLAPRPRAGADEPASPSFSHVWSPDGVAVGSTGRAEARALPQATTIVAVTSPLDVAWHKLTLPKAPASRMRQALAGVLEEQLLEEPEQVHLALAPAAKAGDSGWVAATHRPWISDQLQALAAAHRTVDRLVPASAPGGLASGHFFTGAEADRGGPDDLWLAWADAEGALCLRAAGSLARECLPAWQAQQPRWSATPAAAAAAERWLGGAVSVQTDAEHALAAARSSWNLRQFELAPRSRGLRPFRDFGRHFWGPVWRPIRWGAVALLAVHLVGLNAWAWQQQHTLDSRRSAMNELLRSSHPQVRSVLDAPLQMQRETDLLRAAAGRAGDEDFETLLALAAASWPEGRAPLDQLRFELGRLELPAPGWAPEQVQQLRSKVEQLGGRLSSDQAQLTLSRPARKVQP